MQMQWPGQQQTHKQHRVIQRKDSQHPPSVELPKISFIFERIKQDSRNQKSRQYEKKVDTRISVMQPRPDRSINKSLRLIVGFKRVATDHHQNRESAYPIQRQQMAAR